MPKSEKFFCPGCNRGTKSKDFDTKLILHDGQYWHRTCRLEASGEYAKILTLFKEQDDHVEDPTTAMADLIGQIGQFVLIHNKDKAQESQIDFPEAVRRGLSYWRDEQ